MPRVHITTGQIPPCIAKVIASEAKNEKVNFSLPELIVRAVDTGGKPPDDGDMETRVARLEEFVTDARERLTKIETRLDQIATKSDIADLRVDMHKGFVGISKWGVSAAATVGVAGIVVMTLVLNNALTKATHVAPSAQIIIYAVSLLLRMKVAWTLTDG